MKEESDRGDGFMGLREQQPGLALIVAALVLFGFLAWFSEYNITSQTLGEAEYSCWREYGPPEPRRTRDSWTECGWGRPLLRTYRNPDFRFLHSEIFTLMIPLGLGIMGSGIRSDEKKKRKRSEEEERRQIAQEINDLSYALAVYDSIDDEEFDRLESLKTLHPSPPRKLPDWGAYDPAELAQLLDLNDQSYGSVDLDLLDELLDRQAIFNEAVMANGLDLAELADLKYRVMTGELKDAAVLCRIELLEETVEAWRTGMIDGIRIVGLRTPR